MRACVILTTVAGAAQARELSRALVKQRLAACVTAIPGAVSNYRWKNKTQTSREILLVIKTARKKWPALKSHLQRYHPYEVPEMLLLRVEAGSEDYLKWIESCLKK